MADPEGFQGVRSNPIPVPRFKISYENETMVSMGPNYFVFMGYLRNVREKQQSEPPYLYTYEPPLPEILDPPLKIYMILIMPVTKIV